MKSLLKLLDDFYHLFFPLPDAADEAYADDSVTFKVGFFVFLVVVFYLLGISNA